MAKVELTEDQKCEILRRFHAGQSRFEIKKEMGFKDGRQIAGVISSQHTPTGLYLLKKAGLPGPNLPLPKHREPEAEVVEAKKEGAAPELPKLNPLGAEPAPAQVADGRNIDSLPRSLGPRVPTAAAPSISSAPLALGFRRDGATEKYFVYRESPWQALEGTFTPPFALDAVGAKFGRGDFRIERHVPGRLVPEVQNLTFGAEYGPPRSSGYEAQTNMIPQQPAESASQIANAVVGAMKTGADIVRDQQKPAESKPIDKVVERLVEKSIDQMTNPPVVASAFKWEDYAKLREDERREERTRREMERKDEEARLKRERDERDEERRRERSEREEQYKREKAERDEDYKRRAAEAEEKHKREMERIGTEAAARLKEIEVQATQREKLQKEHETALAEINTAKTNWAMKEMQKAVESSSQALEESSTKLEAEIAKLNAEAEKDRTRREQELTKDRAHAVTMMGMEKEQLKLEKDFQEQLIEIKKAQANVGTESKLYELGERLLNAVNDRTKDILDVKKVEASLQNNPNLVNNVVNNPQLVNKMVGGSKLGDKEMTSKLDQIANTQEFQDFIEEWCSHVEAAFDPEVLFDTLQRRYQKNETGVGELLDFIAGRKWEKAKVMISKHINAEQVAILNTEFAEPYYKKMRSLVVLMKGSAMKQWVKWETERVEAPVPPPSEPAPELVAEPPAPEPAPQQ